jgi:hypothetical protein
MKKFMIVIFTCLLLALLLFAPLLLWNVKFGIGYGGTTEAWSHFGTFYSGIASPLLAFLSFTGVIITIRQQGQSNRLQADANKEAEKNRKLANELQIRVQEKQQENFEISIQNQNAMSFKAQSNVVRTVAIEIRNNTLDNPRVQVVKSSVVLLLELQNLGYDIPERLSSYRVTQRDIIVQALCTAVILAKDTVVHLEKHGYKGNELNLEVFDRTFSKLEKVIEENGGKDD